MLLHCDKLSILLNLRVANYGAQSKAKIRCQDCDTEYEQDISFAFRGRPFRFDAYTRGINQLCYTFPKCKKTVWFRLGTCREHLVYEERGWLAFAKIITRSITDVDNISEFYDYELPATDSRLFREYYENNLPGYANEMTVTCPTCNASKTSKTDVNLEIFGVRPESLSAIHSEIFDLCYYSNGAFTQESVYKMPTSLRSFYIKKLVDTKKSEAAAQEAATTKGESPNSRVASPPRGV